MFRINGNIILFLFFILSICGCSGSSSVDGGLNVSEILTLDNEYESEISTETDQMFALDMNNPLAKGHKLTGASFDPSLLRMERFIEYEDDGMRARYLFTALMDGKCEVLIKMQAISGGEEEVFKRVSVTIGGEDDGWFF
ncbi:hypothetical protein [Pseudodesulfovibrio sediminis]|uniref:Lipoprotein n=1 Tax=Pseudodesulfovibrio sediminis TaxID=2810563 RepID=A0ABM7P3Z8_9BACT|nr:hypothetical protein [Pseudodesulfovibrio sediminis]BCS87573.1 hypothetical protein PSDVSF_08150 [Pseudodesulfovibrio sediminis]